MENIEYSVVIRTLGKANEKYQKLLDSITLLKPQPQEVIVVLPVGYDLPAQRIGNEKFCFCEKGMVNQRLYGIDQCKTPYALVCDDDVAFPSDFVTKLYDPIKQGLCDISAGPLLSFFVDPGIKTIVSIIAAGSYPMLFKKDRYVSVKPCGWSFNRNIDTEHHKFYLTEAAAWTCFFCRVQAIKDIHLEEEKWIDQFGYAAFDDQTMFYKGYVNGILTMIVSDALYEHLDAKTSIKGIKPLVGYTLAFNRIVFWHRFIYNLENSILHKIIDIAFIGYWYIINILYNLVRLLLRKATLEQYKYIRKGMRDGFKYIHSNEYEELPEVKK